MEEKKSFFARPTAAQIKEGSEPVVLEEKLVLSGLQDLKPEQYAVIPERLFDARFNAAKFLKHGDTLELQNEFPFRKIPRVLFKEATNDRQTRISPYISGFSFRPRMGLDRVPRRVPFVELLEAARILAYGKVYPGAAVRIEGDYTDAAKVQMEGGIFLVSTPSRRKKQDRYRFTVRSIPLQYSEPEVWHIPYTFDSEDLGVRSQAFREVRYTRADSPEFSRVRYVQAHAIAAAYAIAEAEWQKNNEVPNRFLPFPVVSQQAVNLYTALLNRTLFEVQEGEKTQQKHLTQAHIEAIMCSLARRQGYEVAFDDTALLEGRVHTYNWNNGIPTQASS